MRPRFWSMFLIAMGLLIKETYSLDDDGLSYKNVLHVTKKLPALANANDDTKKKNKSSVHDKSSREDVSTSTNSATINMTSLESVGYVTKFNTAESSRSKKHFHRNKMFRKDSHVRLLDNTSSVLRANTTSDHLQKKLNSLVESSTSSSHLLQSQISITRHVTERDKHLVKVLDLTSSSSVAPLSQMALSFSKIKARTVSPAENVWPVFTSDTTHKGASSVLSSDSMKNMAIKVHNQWSTSSLDKFETTTINSSYTHFIQNSHLKDSINSGNNVTLYNDTTDKTAENIRSFYPLQLSTDLIKSTKIVENDMHHNKILSNDSNAQGGINFGKIGMSWTSVENISNKASTIDVTNASKNIDPQENWSAVLKSDKMSSPGQDSQEVVSSIAKEPFTKNATDRSATHTIQTSKMHEKNSSEVIVEVPLKVNVPSSHTSSKTSQKFSSFENYKTHLSSNDQTLSSAKCLSPTGFNNNEETANSLEKNTPFFEQANNEISLSVPLRSMRTKGCLMRNVVKLHSKVSNDSENHDVYLQDQSSSFATPSLDIDDKVERSTCSVESNCEPLIKGGMKNESQHSSIQRNLTGKSEFSTNDSQIINELMLVPHIPIYIPTANSTMQRVTSEEVVKETNTTTSISPSILNFHEEIFAISDKSSVMGETSKEAIWFNKNSTTEDTIYIIKGLGYFEDNLDDIAEFEDIERREEPVFNYGENGNDPILLQVGKNNSLKLRETETPLEQSISVVQYPLERNFLDHYDKSWWFNKDDEIGKTFEDNIEVQETLDISSKDEVKRKVKKGLSKFFIDVPTKYTILSTMKLLMTLMVCIVMVALSVWYKRVPIMTKLSLSKLWHFFPKKRRTVEAV